MPVECLAIVLVAESHVVNTPVFIIPERTSGGVAISEIGLILQLGVQLESGCFPTRCPGWECKATLSAEIVVTNEALHYSLLRLNRKGPMSWRIVCSNENLRPE